jgi:hypothetical protein
MWSFGSGTFSSANQERNNPISAIHVSYTSTAYQCRYCSARQVILFICITGNALPSGMNPHPTTRRAPADDVGQRLPQQSATPSLSNAHEPVRHAAADRQQVYTTPNARTKWPTQSTVSFTNRGGCYGNTTRCTNIRSCDVGTAPLRKPTSNPWGQCVCSKPCPVARMFAKSSCAPWAVRFSHITCLR